MNDWKSVLKADPIPWLLEPENPSVRYFTLTDLLGRPKDDPQVLDAKRAIPTSAVVTKIFSRQDPAGFWESPEKPYQPKYKATYWQIMLLALLGLDRQDERVQRACEHIFKFQLQEGGFSELGERAAREEYLWKLEAAQRRGKKPGEEKPFIADLIRQMELSCLTGNVVAALLRFGYGEDPRVGKAIAWLISIQNRDGGWLCPYWTAHLRDTHSCFMGTITPLEAFSELPVEERTKEMKQAIERGAEFLLMHRLFKADRHDFRVIKQDWLEFGFPWFYRYDVLRGLLVLTRLGYTRDERLNDALELLLAKQGRDGRWILESTPAGRMHASLGRKGKPSKWVTLNALRVLKWLGE
jgi:hypothetical protein